MPDAVKATNEILSGRKTVIEFINTSYFRNPFVAMSTPTEYW